MKKNYYKAVILQNAKIKSWSGVLSSSTFGNEGLTFVNTLENKDITQGLTKSYLRTSFVVERADEYEFRKGCVFRNKNYNTFILIDCMLREF